MQNEQPRTVIRASRGAEEYSNLVEIWRSAVSEFGVTKVDVNEQNEGAFGFYRSHGFVQVGRDESDGDGRPYPTLHLELRR